MRYFIFTPWAHFHKLRRILFLNNIPFNALMISLNVMKKKRFVPFEFLKIM